jgi:Rps23 Pro-64 3,4-dihydroxylase Tpa1-like proline 4-hydroxylase
MHDPQREPTFSLNEFRYWLNRNKDDQPERKKSMKVQRNETNIRVESRLGISRLSQKILEHNADTLDKEQADALAMQFKEEGAKILVVEDLMAIIQIDDVKFNLPKGYTRKSESNDQKS